MTNTQNTVEFNPTQTKVKMIKEWTPAQFKEMEAAIKKHFCARPQIVYSNGGGTHTANKFTNISYKLIDELFGLAYTSSGIFACYGVCNVAAYFDADHIYQYSYFTIGEDGAHYAICQDAEENEICIEL